ncbi:MAG: hypothetical protein COV36_02170 [Alphaproteobacteria bacterium CG11_big_fil_rev_8_21_14_0_20_44_7]|nr:MAG: hypothetical protein COV36_02170 [Alphaproteobacteria bacterium CG11_big_fil_rev_8_21_14_0_20_44_7]
MELFILIFVAILGVMFWAMVIYNRLIALQQTRKSSFADIDVQLKLRHDLIPNLVETVKKYAAHESEVFTQVTEARSQAMQAKSVDAKSSAETFLDKAMMNLLAVAENYPELKADAIFNRFQGELSALEKSIAAARRFFNNATAELNTTSQQFPASVIANMFKFKEEEFFELEEDKRKTLDEPLKVQF